MGRVKVVQPITKLSSGKDKNMATENSCQCNRLFSLQDSFDETLSAFLLRTQTRETLCHQIYYTN